MACRRTIKGFLLLTIPFVLLGFIWVIYPSASCVVVPISMSEDLFPRVTVDIDGQPYQLGFDLIDKHPLWLCAEVLGGVSKMSKGEGSYKDVTGQEHWAPLYEVPHVKLGLLDLKNLRMSSNRPIAPESVGSISWPFDKMNLLLDFPQHRVWGVPNERSLSKLGFDLSKMEKIKCRITKKGIYLDAATPSGPLTLMLTTMVNQNAIAKHVATDSKPYWVKTQLGSRSYGESQFFPYQITPELEADGFLGVRFFMDHVVYIDARHEVLYIGEKYRNTLSTSEIVKIPLDFTVAGLPVMQVDVDQKQHHVVFDTGTDQELSLLADDFEIDSLEYLGSHEVFNMLGESSEIHHHLLPECRVEGVALKQVVVSRVEEVPMAWVEIANEERGTFEDDWGILGRALLHRTNLYIDFPNAAMWFVKDRQGLKAVGFDWEEAIAVPFEADEEGIILMVATDIGQLKMLLDTGAPTSVVHAFLAQPGNLALDEWDNPCIFNKSLVMGGYDFGKHSFHPIELRSDLERFSGILGMDFLREHPFYIDYQNRVLYFERSL